ncbi:hypothetical protein LNQ81_14010 [Myroides sp. M-43]|uniref:hypothetical protein n=1 Tax=Myroides oncorhynchi TaxID=2893756 RepID=UPI001E5D0237|nr:hypothetical protein [Myroides oncorhynchi]MCC9043790.1 hypothetical protein [Myroides oncorhynchi]
MLKNILLMSTLILLFSSCKQEEVKDTEVTKTKIETLVSNTGSIVKLVDTTLPNLQTSYSKSETRIRKITNGSETAYFYQIESKGKYNKSTASIEYADIDEVLKALKVLLSEVEADVISNPDYTENKFVTVDGFQVGYYVSEAKANWFITLERTGSDNTLFISEGKVIETAFTDAKNKIDMLKNK